MYNKANLFPGLSKTQKTALLNFIKVLVKKNPDFSPEQIIEKFLEDETYYYELNNPHFEWVVPFFENDAFLKDLKIHTKECFKQAEYKKKQQPYLEKQKAYAKKLKKAAREKKLSKQEPTPKQIKYYKNLSRKYNLKLKPLEDASRLDLINWIDEIIISHTPKVSVYKPVNPEDSNEE